MGDAEFNVDGIDIDTAFDWLEDRGIRHKLHSLEEMKDLIRSYIKADTNPVQKRMEFPDSNLTNTALQTVLSKNNELRNRMDGIYGELLNAFKRHPYWTDLYSYLSAWCGCDVVTKIKHNIRDLQRTDCPIIIEGDSHAGKTSILNLLLGEDVLPVGLLSSSSTVCVVHPIDPGEDPYFTVEGDQNKHVGVKEQVVEKLKAILASRSNNDNLNTIDLYWQVPALGYNFQKNVVFVDLPGCVEKSKVYEHLLDYQSSAATVIYVLNSANVGCVHKKTLLQTLSQVKGLDNAVGLFGVDSPSILVVCNKWDVIEHMDKREEGTAQKVWDDASTMLQKYFPGFSPQHQMYKMDTLKTIRYIKSGMCDTSLYIDFKRGLSDLALECHNKRSYMHSRWLFSFVKKIEHFITTKIHSSNSSGNEITQLLRFVTIKLENLDSSLEQTDNNTSVEIDRVGDLDMDAAFDWLEARGISHHLNSVEEMRDLIRSIIRKNDTKSGQPKQMTTMDEEDFQKVLSKDKEIRDTIEIVYKDILNTFEKHPTWVDLKAYSSSFCGCDVVKKLTEHINKLQHTDCPIVITGETSSGKSCFLNLLLGADVLPSGVLCTTATICAIHPIPSGEDPYFTVDLDETKHFGNKTDLMEELKAILTCRSDTRLYKQVHIYWQVPLLGLNRHVVLVDTPGVGESEAMTAKLFEYLPNAAAFIYFINSANAGGVQEDKLVTIFKKVLEYDQSRDLFSFDPTCMLFVCNKWDVIEDREQNGEEGLQEKVWEDIKSKLHKYLPGYQFDSHVLRLSTAEAIRYMKTGIDGKIKFEELKVRLKNLILQSQTSTCTMHYRWLVSFLRNFEIYISTKRRHASVVDKEIVLKKANTKLKEIKTTAIQLQKLIKDFSISSSLVKDAVFNHVNQVDVRIRLMRFFSPLNLIGADVKEQKWKVFCLVMQSWAQRFWHRTIANLMSLIKEMSEQLLDEFVVVEADINRLEHLVQDTAANSYLLYNNHCGLESCVLPGMFILFYVFVQEVKMMKIVENYDHISVFVAEYGKCLHTSLSSCCVDLIDKMWFIKITSRIHSNELLLDLIKESSRNESAILSECHDVEKEVQFFSEKVDTIRKMIDSCKG